MNFTKTIFALAIGSVGIMGAMSASAAVVNTGDKLSITSGVPAFDGSGTQTNVSGGSWFAMDTNGNSKIAGTEKVILSEGTTGLVIGVTTSQGASHSGAPTAGDTNAITAPWNFFGNTGSDYVTVAVTGDTTNGLNMSGWTVTWNGIAAIPMGSGAWVPAAPIAGMAAGPYTNGVAKFSWNGINGGAYTLDYLATVPLGDPSKFGGVGYALHLEGCVPTAMILSPGDCGYVPMTPTIPEASTYGMMLAGLGLVGLMASRRRKSI